MATKTKSEPNNEIFLGYFNNKRDFILILSNILLYGILDLLSTIVGISSGISNEHNEFLKGFVLQDNWIFIFILIKIVILGIFFLHYYWSKKLIGQYILLFFSVILTIGKIEWYLL